MTRQSNNYPITGYSHYSRKEVFRKLGLSIVETETPKPEPVPLFEEPELIIDEVTEEPASEPVVEEVQPEPVVEETVEEPQEQPKQEEEVAPETNDTPEEPETAEEVKTPIEVLDLKKTWIKNLEANNITTVEDLADYLASGKSLEDFSNLSAAAIKSINEKFEQWQNEQK